MIRDALDGELGVLRQLTARLRSVSSRLAWKSAMQQRTTRIIRVLRIATRAVCASGVQRRKANGKWWITLVDDTGAICRVIELDTRTAGRTLQELASPVLVRVHRPDIVMIEQLKELEEEGLVRLVIP